MRSQWWEDPLEEEQESIPVRYPRDFGLEALEMILFALEVRLGDKEWEVAVAHAHLLEARIEEGLDCFPYCVAWRLRDGVSFVLIAQGAIGKRTFKM